MQLFVSEISMIFLADSVFFCLFVSGKSCGEIAGKKCLQNAITTGNIDEVVAVQ